MSASRVAVLDTSAVVAGVGWHFGPARQILCRLALREFLSAGTPALAAEWAATVSRVADEERLWKNRNWSAWLHWLDRVSRPFDPVPLGRTWSSPGAADLHDARSVLVSSVSVPV